MQEWLKVHGSKSTHLPCTWPDWTSAVIMNLLNEWINSLQVYGSFKDIEPLRKPMIEPKVGIINVKLLKCPIIINLLQTISNRCELETH